MDQNQFNKDSLKIELSSLDENSYQKNKIVTIKNDNHLNPTTEIEIKLFNIWEKILNKCEFGITDNFFEIGGSSLKVVALIGLINKEFNLKLTIIDLLEYTDIKSCADFLEKIISNNTIIAEESHDDSFDIMNQTLNVLNDDE